MNPVLLQKQLKDNAKDLNEFFEDLKSWGQEMKNKEDTRQKPPNDCNEDLKKPEKKNIKKPIEKKPKQTGNTVSKLGVTDYSAWEKFDADAECEKVDYNENEESDLTDECNNAVRDEAYVEKEKGNKFVKNKNWDEAIGCYSKAINLYAYDAVFYANRALCFFKKGDHTKAELDCMMSLKLDNSYVKAYQRRAAAREALGKIEEAEADLLKVMELEPTNKESAAKLVDLRKKLGERKKIEESTQRPVSKFTASRNKRRDFGNNVAPVGTNNMVHQVTPPSKSDDCILVKPINKPKHLQSSTPLKRIHIEEVVDVGSEDNKTVTQPPPKQMFQSNRTLKTDDLKVIEKQIPENRTVEAIKQNKNFVNNTKMKEEPVMTFNCPKNFIQFNLHWKNLKTVDEKFIYLSNIKPENLPIIFGESLESDIFSDIVEVLAEYSIKNKIDVYYFLMYLTEMKRFSTIVLFMTSKDKTHLQNLLTHLKQSEQHSEEEINHLFKKYELVY